MFKIHPEIPESLSLEAKAFILRCFEPDPHKRAIASDLLRDTFVRHNAKGKKSKIAFKPSGEHTCTASTLSSDDLPAGTESPSHKHFLPDVPRKIEIWIAL